MGHSIQLTRESTAAHEGRLDQNGFVVYFVLHVPFHEQAWLKAKGSLIEKPAAIEMPVTSRAISAGLPQT